MSEVIFEMREADEGGFWARSPGHSIFTQGEDWNELRSMVKDAVACHFAEDAGRSMEDMDLMILPKERRLEVNPASPDIACTSAK
jgi:hypothetical protein